MNDKFYSLPLEKRQSIINAGYKVFSQNSYKNAPVKEIADEANISKSLLFYYFKNKKELYLYLWENCAQITLECLKKHGCYEKCDYFSAMERGMKAKMEIIRSYPNMGNFVIKAYYEEDKDISLAINESYQKHLLASEKRLSINLDPDQFVDGLDLEMMRKEMHYASEGYLWNLTRQEKIDFEKMEEEFSKLIEYWKSIYLKKG